MYQHQPQNQTFQSSRQASRPGPYQTPRGQTGPSRRIPYQTARQPNVPPSISRNDVSAAYPSDSLPQSPYGHQVEKPSISPNAPEVQKASQGVANEEQILQHLRDISAALSGIKQQLSNHGQEFSTYRQETYNHAARIEDLTDAVDYIRQNLEAAGAFLVSGDPALNDNGDMTKLLNC
nr:uncharacterized protein CTRU02_05579 [Colletotrichum truncatum]KAF6794022.1 hypothetical protein CTRU02_05579 [Colletotrichum truncatum]